MEVDSLRVWYHGAKGNSHGVVKAVDGVSFSLELGRTTGLVGESGSGKSTIGRALVRLVDLNDGEIRYHGNSVQNLRSKELKLFRKKIQMVFQDPYHTLNPAFTIAQTLEEPLKIHFPGRTTQERKDSAAELMRQVGLDPQWMHRYPHQFSGGQRQRIGIARALSVEPEILICDEAVSALDVSIQAQIVNLLQDLQEDRGFACLFIGHDLAVMKHISDEILVMKDGKIVERGDTQSLFNDPKTDYTKRLLAAVPRIRSFHSPCENHNND